MNTSKIIDQLKPSVYTWKNDSESKKSFGFIAQDLLEIFPENDYDIVQMKPDGFYSVNYYQLIPILVSEIKNLRNRINKLENK